LHFSTQGKAQFTLKFEISRHFGQNLLKYYILVGSNRKGSCNEVLDNLYPVAS
jgi:hypothetical protein